MNRYLVILKDDRETYIITEYEAPDVDTVLADFDGFRYISVESAAQ